MPLIGFLSFCFLGFTLLNRILEGALQSSSDAAIFSTLYIFRPVNLGLFTMPVPNLSFFTTGIPALLKWDYSFLGGNAGIITYFLYAVTTMVAFILFGLVIG